MFIQYILKSEINDIYKHLYNYRVSFNLKCSRVSVDIIDMHEGSDFHIKIFSLKIQKGKLKK